MPLEYPITREYTIPHLTTYLSAISIIAITILAILNVVLQGYDVVTVLRPDPNVTHSYWWSIGSLSLRSAGNCDPVSLPKKMTFSTNSSIFTYVVRSTFDANNQNIIGASSYIANPLGSCTVDGIIVDIDISRRRYKFDTPILCTGSNLPFSLSIASTFLLDQYNPYYDDIMAYYIQNKPARNSLSFGQSHIQRNATSLTNIVGILDAISADLMISLWLLGNSSTDTISPATISTGGFPACPGGRNATCKPDEMRMIIPASLLSYPNGSYVSSNGIGTFLAPIETSFLNMFTVLQDAYHIDLGNIKSYNTILNKDAFSARIYPEKILSAAAHNISGFGLCSSGLGCTYNSTWAQKLLASDPDLDIVVPSTIPTGDAPAVIRVDYLCPQFRLKSPGSLITSVFIGTWTMYTALFGIFNIIGPILEKRYNCRRTTKTLGVEGVSNEGADAWSLLVQPGRDSRRVSSSMWHHHG
ncbi:hypothetical protein FRC12_007430 [Ceratobasidium sp. 428]|nr:hypothetical protein FRC12_007430 [Ceratobasidium sp. 428]